MDSRSTHGHRRRELFVFPPFARAGTGPVFVGHPWRTRAVRWSGRIVVAAGCVYAAVVVSGVGVGGRPPGPPLHLDGGAAGASTAGPVPVAASGR